MTSPSKKYKERPPIVVVMGHIDHGKSTLLDYIRKTNTTLGEAGGITQRMGAYEAMHTDEKGVVRRITFIDTPGHAAFQAMRERGAKVADIAILVVSAEEGVKTQTLEAYREIVASDIPFIVALNKIDRPEASVERTLASLAEAGVYVEGRGGDIPYVALSAKSGEGVPALLEILLLLSQLRELKGDPTLPAEGIVIESERTAKRGTAAVVIITNGTLKKGMHVLAGTAIAPVRGMEDSVGRPVASATFSSPVRITGFDLLPQVGTTIRAFASKKEAEKARDTQVSLHIRTPLSAHPPLNEDCETLPVVIKADVVGVVEAIEQAISEYKNEHLMVKVLARGVGPVTEGDIKAGGNDTRTVIIAFNVPVESGAQDIAERLGMTIASFNIIYKLIEWFEAIAKERTPKQHIEKIKGRLKVLKHFSKAHTKQVVGGRVEEGAISEKDVVHILRRNEPIGEGTIIEVQKGKARAHEASEGEACGIKVESRTTIAQGDVLEARTLVEE